MIDGMKAFGPFLDAEQAEAWCQDSTKDYLIVDMAKPDSNETGFIIAIPPGDIPEKLYEIGTQEGQWNINNDDEREQIIHDIFLTFP